MGMESGAPVRETQQQPQVAQVENFNPFPHPQNTAQVVSEARGIEMIANSALHSTSGSEMAKEFNKIQELLKNMTESERKATLGKLDDFGKVIEDDGTRKAGRSSLPDVTLDKDEKGKVTSITFKSVSDDTAYGKSFKIALNDATTANGKETKVGADGSTELENKHGDKYTLDADGKLKSYSYVDKDGKVLKKFDILKHDDKDGSIKQIADENGNLYTKHPDDPDSGDLHVINGVGWDWNNTKTGATGRSAVPLGVVTVSAKDGLHVEVPGVPRGPSIAKSQLGIIQLERKNEGE